MGQNNSKRKRKRKEIENTILKECFRRNETLLTKIACFYKAHQLLQRKREPGLSNSNI